jgi:hypothetical protein
VKRFRSKKAIAVLVAGAIALGGAGAALAYFTSSGSGTGNATVGTSTAFVVATSAPTGGLLYPGTGDDNVAYTITNPAGSGTQNLSTTSAALTTDTNGGVYDTKTSAFNDSCLASWFTVTNNAPTYGEIADGASVSGSADIVLNDVNVDQDACQGVYPQVTITAG